jgi:hypothetical protein
MPARIKAIPSSNPRSLAAAIRQEVQTLDKEQSVANVRTLQQVVSDSVTPRRLAAVMLGIFASIALALASVGIYGVQKLMDSVASRRIGMRARRQDHRRVWILSMRKIEFWLGLNVQPLVGSPEDLLS